MSVKAKIGFQRLTLIVSNIFVNLDFHQMNTKTARLLWVSSHSSHEYLKFYMPCANSRNCGTLFKMGAANFLCFL